MRWAVPVGMNLLRTTLGTVLLLVLVLVTTACNDQNEGEETVMLEVETVDWSGWDPDHEPKPSKIATEVSEGSTFEVEVLGGPAIFEVTDINDDEIELETGEAFSLVNAHGGFDLTDSTNDFTLDRSGNLEIATPTTDMGTHVTLRVA